MMSSDHSSIPPDGGDAGESEPDGSPSDILSEMPPYLAISTPQQLKAVSEPTRLRILGVLQLRAATAKQMADVLALPPGTVGHHLQTLEAAGLVRVVARRIVRGIVAKYYARTARIFVFDFPVELVGSGAVELRFLTDTRDELADALAADPQAMLEAGMPRARLSAERMAVYKQRLDALMDEFVHEPPDPEGEVVTLSLAFFKSPPYLQHPQRRTREDARESDAGSERKGEQR